MKKRRRLTEHDLSPASRQFWRERGKLGAYPLALLVALDHQLDREYRGWVTQLTTAFSTSRPR